MVELAASGSQHLRRRSRRPVQKVLKDDRAAAASAALLPSAVLLVQRQRLGFAARQLFSFTDDGIFVLARKASMNARSLGLSFDPSRRTGTPTTIVAARRPPRKPADFLQQIHGVGGFVIGVAARSIPADLQRRQRARESPDASPPPPGCGGGPGRSQERAPADVTVRPKRWLVAFADTPPGQADHPEPELQYLRQSSEMAETRRARASIGYTVSGRPSVVVLLATSSFASTVGRLILYNGWVAKERSRRLTVDGYQKDEMAN